jgi:ATP-binding cassette subfamily B protein
LPHGFDTVVGEKGVILSGGQKQRVALARAFLNDAPILVLDDPVSQVDTRTAARIVDTLRTLSGDKTLIIISHRLSAVRHADQIVVMEMGRIVTSGSHAQLMAAGGYYARAHGLQELENAI